VSLQHLRSLDAFYQGNLIARSDFLSFRRAMVTAKNEAEMEKILLKVARNLKKAGKLPASWRTPSGEL
jgi:hypothetical protein